MPKSSQATVHYWAKDYSTGGPIPVADVSLCSFANLDCNTPLQHGTTGSDGYVALSFQNSTAVGPNSNGLNGYLKLSAPSYVPYFDYCGFPITEPDLYLYTEPLKISDLQGDYAAVSMVQDLMRATIGVVVYDCLLSPAADVQVTVSNADGLTHSFTATGAATDTTDRKGFLIFANVPAGDAQVVARPAGLKQRSSTVSVTVRAGSQMIVRLYPTP
jgi:hypothetical protein